MQTPEIIRVIQQAHKHSAPPSLWANVERQTYNRYSVTCKEYGNTVIINFNKRFINIDDRLFGYTDYQDILNYVWRRFQYSAEEIVEQDERIQRLKEEKEKRMGA